MNWILTFYLDFRHFIEIKNIEMIVQQTENTNQKEDYFCPTINKTTLTLTPSNFSVQCEDIKSH